MFSDFKDFGIPHVNVRVNRWRCSETGLKRNSCIHSPPPPFFLNFAKLPISGNVHNFAVLTMLVITLEP